MRAVFLMRQTILSAIVCLGLTASAFAQLAPSIGYVFPPGGQAGTSIEVTLGGYDWTPDMQVFVHDPRITLEILGKPGPIIVPEPPYWFGKKARRSAFLLPRETKAKLTIPADVPPGIISWQAANANGASDVGFFVVSADPQINELDGRSEPQELESLPVVVAGQIKHIEEVDEYNISVPKSGPVTCSLCARKIGSELNAVLEVYDSKGELVGSAADTAGNDTELTFAAEANAAYTVRVYDLDFRGNRAFVYRLRIASEPRVVAAFPPVGRRGETRDVKFLGYGIATGRAQLESINAQISFPADQNLESFPYRLKTPFGESAPVELSLSDLPETVKSAESIPALSPLPMAVSGVLEERFGEHRYRFSAKKGDVLDVELSAAKFGSPLDVSIAVYDASGKPLAQNDDLPGTTDAGLSFNVPADGEYQIGVMDVSGNSGQETAIYRLVIQKPAPGFTFTGPKFLNIPIGSAGKIALKAERSGGFNDPVRVTLTGLPEGVTVPKDLLIPAGQTALNIDLTVPKDAPAAASLVKIVGEATIDGKSVRYEPDPFVIATTISPPFAIDAEGKDDVTKWPRGTVFPAPVLIERNEGFHGEIVLEMTSRQGRHRQGITGPERKVPPGVGRMLYPVTLPEWLETTRTSRMVVNGVAKVADPKGNIRYSVSRQKTRMGFLPTGALLKLAAETDEFSITPGQPISVPLSISRSPKLPLPARIELRLTDRQEGLVTAEAQTVSAEQDQVQFLIVPQSSTHSRAEEEITIRATVLQEGNLPVISETKVLLLFDRSNASKPKT